MRYGEKREQHVVWEVEGVGGGGGCGGGGGGGGRCGGGGGEGAGGGGVGGGFFFQAEDGIRDRDVTGVQTCASDLLILLIGHCLHK